MERQGRPPRDFSVDALRAIAIIEVVLAHTAMPAWLFQARNFGVPLLIMLSGMAFMEASAARELKTVNYMKRRFTKLVLPTWYFLLFYFTATFLLAVTGVFTADYIAKGRFDVLTIAGSFLLLQGIGYVWVIRVNLVVSAMAPTFLRLMRRWSSGQVLLLCAGMIILNQLLIEAFLDVASVNETVKLLVGSFVFYGLAYGAIFLVGMNANRMSGRLMVSLAVTFLAIFAVIAGSHYFRTGTFRQTQWFKYPPQFYYLSYALGVSFVLLAIRGPIAALARRLNVEQAMSFVGANTLWIYLWHIFMLDLAQAATAHRIVPDHFLMTWILTATTATLATYLQTTAMARLKPPGRERAPAASP